MIRVLHVIATLDPAGAERQLVQLCSRLDRNEFEPSVCCLTRGGPLERDLEEAAVSVDILHKRGRWDVAAVRRLARLMRRSRPDIVHTWLPTANTLGRLSARLARVPVVLACERAADVWKGPLRRWGDRRLASTTHTLVTNADAVRRFLVDRIGLPERKIVVIRNGLDVAEFDAAAERGPSPPLPEPGGALVIGTVGRLEEQKGTTHLIRALSMLPPDLAETQLWIAGAGPKEQELRRQAAAAGLERRIRFLGLRSDVPALLRHLDLFVLPSLWEGLPNADLEAMSARRAVAATAVNGTPEAVAAGETGLLVPPADPEALADAMTALLRDPALRRAFGDAGRRRVELEFTMERMVARMQELYRRAMAGD